VVDVLAGQQRAPNPLLHHVAVFEHLSAIGQGDADVPVLPDVPPTLPRIGLRTPPCAGARVRAVPRWSSPEPGWETGNRPATGSAGAGNLSSPPLRRAFSQADALAGSAAAAHRAEAAPIRLRQAGWRNEEWATAGCAPALDPHVSHAYSVPNDAHLQIEIVGALA
jgi:hypothetical protein